MSGVDQAQLERLQAELVALRSSLPGGLLLKKSASSPSSPFPVTATATVDAPAAASRFDVQQLTVQVTINAAALASPGAGAGGTGDAVSIAILNEDLPPSLRSAIAAELQAARVEKMRGDVDTVALLHLHEVFCCAQQQYAHLLSLLPQLLEHYEGVDAAGRTVRRVAVLNDQASVSVGVSAAAELPPLQRNAARSVKSEGTALNKASSGALSADACEREVGAVQKRYPGTKVGWPLPRTEAAAALKSSLASLSLAEVASGARSPSGCAAKSPATAESPATAAFILTVPVRPTDPEWATTDGPLVLNCSIGPAYPAPGSFTVCLSEECAALSELARSVFDRLLEAEVAGAAGRPGASSLRAVLRQCESHGGGMVRQAVDISLEVQQQRRAAAQQEATAAGAAPAGPKASRGDSEPSYGSSDECESSYTGSWSGSEGGGGDSPARKGSLGSESGASSSSSSSAGGDAGWRAGTEPQRALRLVLDGLDLVDIDALEPIKLNLQVACARCRATSELSFSTEAVSASGAGNGGMRHDGECGACHAPWAVAAVPKLVHERSNVLASVVAEGCVPLDLLPSILAAQCDECTSPAAFREAHVGRWNERACSKCHRRLAFKLDAALFVAGGQRAVQAAGPSGGSGSRGPLSGAPSAVDFGRPLVPGHPLPDRGTCVHYRHSYRWLRFPCCGRRFPCDLCHELGVDDGHAAKWAQRMVCGFCSKEQPVAERCVHCDKKVAGSARNPSGRATKFWEGGQGQRDQRRLSRRDPHRWKNSRAKTRSNKQARVGQKLSDSGA